jgi:hypothetical protein
VTGAFLSTDVAGLRAPLICAPAARARHGSVRALLEALCRLLQLLTEC